MTGNVHWIEESETHQLYALNKDGQRTGKYVTVKDRTILDTAYWYNFIE